MKTFYFASFLLTILLLSQAKTTHAQNAGVWTFPNTTAGTAGSNITVSNATFGTSIGSGAFNTINEYYGQDGWPTGALDLNAYLQFTVTAGSAYYLVLNTVSLYIRRSTTGTAAGSGPQQFSLRSSLDGYTTDIGTGTLNLNYTTYSITLPAAFQSIPSTVTFRLYGYNSVTTSGGSNRFVYQNITIAGQAMSGTLAQQDIQLTAGTTAAGAARLQYTASGFAAGTVFVAERSLNGSDFTAIGQQENAGDAVTAYEVADTYPSGSPVLFYRVRAEEPGGSSYLSPVVTVNTGNTANLKIRGVVAQGNTVKALIDIPENGQYQLSVYGMDGKALYNRSVSASPGAPVVDIAFGQYPHGIYVLMVSKGDQRISREFLF